MNLIQIDNIWHEFNYAIFIPAGCPLNPDVVWRRTRSRSYWACWDDADYGYYWSYNIDECSDVRSLIFHEMVHQWQTEYMNASDESHHDRYFFGWHQAAFLNGLILEEIM